MSINEECLHTNIIPIPSLSDSDKKNILANAAVTPGAGSHASTVQRVIISLVTQEGVPNLVTVMLVNCAAKLVPGTQNRKPMS